MFNNNKVAVMIYSILSVVFVFLGTLLSNDLVWELTDFFNYLMVIPNVLGLIPLAAIVSNASKKESPLK
jgi:AGCS family alanine or glycine:cation symporter